MQLGWSQAELAARAGVTRQLIGAVEAGRHTPGVHAALGLASALGTTVEELFAEGAIDTGVVHLFEPGREGRVPMVTVRVGDETVAVPVVQGVAGAESWAVADGVGGPGGFEPFPRGAADGLIISGCDPLLGLLAGLVGRATSDRIVTAQASTGRSVGALERGRVHGVVVHGPPGDLPVAPASVRRWHLARWEVGLAGRGQRRLPSLEELTERRRRVIQRDPGAATQRAFERALASIGAGGGMPGPVADGHLDVARRVAHGAAPLGLTMGPAARAFDLTFTALELHDVELWLDDRWAELPAARALVDQLGDPTLARRVDAIGGYDLAGCGDLRNGAA